MPPASIAYPGVDVPVHNKVCAAIITDFIPDAQTLLIVVQLVLSGSPAPSTASKVVAKQSKFVCESTCLSLVIF